MKETRGLGLGAFWSSGSSMGGHHLADVVDAVFSGQVVDAARPVQGLE